MSIKERMAEKMAGEITLSREPGPTIRKWREIFETSQTELAEHLRVSPSVISDYESGRRKSPGTLTVQRIVRGLLDIDEERGDRVLRNYQSMMETNEAIIDIRELLIPVQMRKFVAAIEGEVLANEDNLDRELKGYTVIDSVKAITSLTAFEYMKIYGWTSERALVFTGISTGRSPMVAIRVHPMKPALIVYHKPERMDDLALRLAKTETIPLVVTRLPLERLLEVCRDIG
ncbi:MAG TPA: helix-turn-helix domain-containing protein [Candidatus Thermoplasmatota archaeon]|nr:helix-turn-helix domain-containing protein [Candidatus Thermoplasmatota archaeon]